MKTTETTLGALMAAGHAVSRRADSLGVKVDDAPFERRPAAERVVMLKPRTIILQDKTKTGKLMRKPKTLDVRQVAYYPANLHGKAPSIPQGLTECPTTHEVFFVWTHKTRVERAGVVTYPAKYYDLAPELQAEVFKSQEENAAIHSEIGDLLAEASR